jgi:soluble lytic murein transglycosylase-like protein
LKTIKIELLIIGILLFSSFNIIVYQPLSKQDYYSEITRKPELIKEIFFVNQKYNIEPELLIALCYQESGFSQFAIGKNPKSLDRGYFQLNNQYFEHPYIFETSINVFLGISYFDYCLKKSGGNVRIALYIYNSGCPYPIHAKAEKRADLIIQTALKLRYNYERYRRSFTVEYFR